MVEFWYDETGELTQTRDDTGVMFTVPASAEENDTEINAEVLQKADMLSSVKTYGNGSDPNMYIGCK